ncbi:hypothetical protein A0H81_02229 [Grifola frondosa]|uniref:Uncharacterized protein n=1 Tax=Grifola frondosa TaxID=5627 RepID=A0A1C7MN10_GRIFR|nr:hypothetical protein A0H81_02229 [Grifola frondosa]
MGYLIGPSCLLLSTLPMDKRNTEFRLARLTKLLDIILLGKQTINPQNGPLFLEALSTHPDPATCISRLITAKTGLPSLQSSMRFDLSEAFLNGLATDFIMSSSRWWSRLSLGRIQPGFPGWNTAGERAAFFCVAATAARLDVAGEGYSLP